MKNILLVALLLVGRVYGQQVFSTDLSVVIQWNANTESDLAGYKLYWDTNSSPPYANNVVVGNVTVYNKTFSEGTYYIAVTAFDNAGNESSYSNEVSFVMQAPSGGTVTDSLCVYWNRPVRWNDGSPLAASNIDHYEVLAKLSTQADWAFATVLNQTDIPPAANPVSWCGTISLADGTYDLAVRTITVENATEQEGLISAKKTLVVPIVFEQRIAERPIRIVISPKQ